MPQFQVSSTYTKEAMATNVKNVSTYPFSSTLLHRKIDAIPNMNANGNECL